MTQESEPVVYVNGEFQPSRAASVSVFDHGLLYGDGVFDTMFASYGYIFKLDQHIARLSRSMRAVRLEIAISLDALRDAVVETVARNGLRSAYIKVLVTRGVSPEPLLDPRECTPTLIIFARPYLSLADPEKLGSGLHAKVVSIRRVDMQALDPRIKSLNYLNLVLARMEAYAAGCDEALLLDSDGNVCEAPGYNVFVVKDGRLTTPATGILEGITRETVLELCEQVGIPSEIRSVAPYELAVADEVFLSSTAGGLVPISRVDGQPVGLGRPGPVIAELLREYDTLQESGKCGTPVTTSLPADS